ncbi:GIY-YIG nuclease family protein [Streptomyces hydrogenans]|uniref:GIY-YIG nuclease family protein n=1 Tax=Streptomyces hydrogenans TaxID=1873719 RepID=UPI0036E7D8F5
MSTSSFVYVIGPPGSTRVKIGTSVNPDKRLKELQTGNPDRLEVLWSTPGGRELETALHQAFAAYRTEGEWFDFGGIEPVGAIPRAVQQHANPKARGRVPAAPTGPHSRAEHVITPERLAGIVRDIVVGVVRPSDEAKNEDGEPVEKAHRLDRVSHALDRFGETMYGRLARRTAERIVAGQTEPAAFAPLVLGFVLTLPLTLPIAAFLAIRLCTRDIWPVRKLPLLIGFGWTAWDPFGLDKLIRDHVLRHLPMEEISSFVHTYFAQAATAGAWYLAAAAFILCLIVYMQQVREQAEELREEKARAKAEKAERKKAEERAALSKQLSGGALLGLGGVPLSPLIADLTRAIPTQPVQGPVHAPVASEESRAKAGEGGPGSVP